MKDNDIIKALECCVGGHCISDGCPIYDAAEHGSVEKCFSVLTKNTFDLINRQKAEIERLTAERDVLKGWERLLKAEAHVPIIKKAKSEAIKEFAERLKERKYVSSDWSHGEHPFVVEEVDIDEVLEEMTEVRENA